MIGLELWMHPVFEDLYGTWVEWTKVLYEALGAVGEAGVAASVSADGTVNVGVGLSTVGVVVRSGVLGTAEIWSIGVVIEKSGLATLLGASSSDVDIGRDGVVSTAVSVLTMFGREVVAAAGVAVNAVRDAGAALLRLERGLLSVLVPTGAEAVRGDAARGMDSVAPSPTVTRRELLVILESGLERIAGVVGSVYAVVAELAANAVGSVKEVRNTVNETASTGAGVTKGGEVNVSGTVSDSVLASVKGIVGGSARAVRDVITVAAEKVAAVASNALKALWNAVGVVLASGWRKAAPVVASKAAAGIADAASGLVAVLRGVLAWLLEKLTARKVERPRIELDVVMPGRVLVVQMPERDSDVYMPVRNVAAIMER